MLEQLSENKSLGLVYRHAPGINTGGKDPTKICMT